jgi:hypothetical protein
MVAMVRNPAWANRIAVLRPMPVDVPVMTATLFMWTRHSTPLWKPYIIEGVKVTGDGSGADTLCHR